MTFQEVFLFMAWNPAAKKMHNLQNTMIHIITFSRFLIFIHDEWQEKERYKLSPVLLVRVNSLKFKLFNEGILVKEPDRSVF